MLKLTLKSGLVLFQSSAIRQVKTGVLTLHYCDFENHYGVKRTVCMESAKEQITEYIKVGATKFQTQTAEETEHQAITADKAWRGGQRFTYK